MATKLVNLGFNNVVMGTHIVCVVSPEAAPIKRLREEARRKNKSTTSTRRPRSMCSGQWPGLILRALDLQFVQ